MLKYEPRNCAVSHRRLWRQASTSLRLGLKMSRQVRKSARHGMSCTHPVHCCRCFHGSWPGSPVLFALKPTLLTWLFTWLFTARRQGQGPSAGASCKRHSTEAFSLAVEAGLQHGRCRWVPGHGRVCALMRLGWSVIHAGPLWACNSAQYCKSKSEAEHRYCGPEPSQLQP